MKKIRIFVFLIFFVVFVFLFNNIISYGAFSIGNYTYSHKNYQVAKKYYQKAYFLKPDNPDFKDKYIKALIKLPLDYQIQKELFDVYKSDTTSPAVIEAYKRLEKFRDTVYSSFEPNYFPSCMGENQKIIRWDETKFPLTVYIKKDKTAKSWQIDLVKSAFKEWDSLINNFFKFKFVDDESDANIVVNYDLSLHSDAKNDRYFVGALTTPVINNKNMLEKMVISVNLKDNHGVQIPDDLLYSTVLHEIGHALGIMGHSNDFDDLMYISSTGKFTKRDINTIKLLYLIVPDVSNTTADKLNVKSRIYAPIISGFKNDADVEQYKKAVTYIQRAPDVAAGWDELAIYYYQTKDYPKSIKAYLKAKSLARSDNEKVYLNFKIAMVYMELKDYNNAISYLQTAQQIQPNTQLRSLEAFAKINAGAKNEGIKMLQEVFVLDPANLENGFLLADALYSNMDYLGTISVLKKMKKANPQFNNDIRKNRYKYINIFI